MLANVFLMAHFLHILKKMIPQTWQQLPIQSPLFILLDGEHTDIVQLERKGTQYDTTSWENESTFGVVICGVPFLIELIARQQRIPENYNFERLLSIRDPTLKPKRPSHLHKFIHERNNEFMFRSTKSQWRKSSQVTRWETSRVRKTWTDANRKGHVGRQTLVKP